MIAILGKALDASLAKKRFELPEGGWLEIDGCCESPRVMCEAWAHIGTPKSAQKNKVMADAMKLLFAVSLAPGNQRLILAFTDESAASHFRGDSWMAQALKEKGIDPRGRTQYRWAGAWSYRLITARFELRKEGGL